MPEEPALVRGYRGAPARGTGRPDPLVDPPQTISTDRVRVPKAAELVASDLRGRIARRDLVAGSMLPRERELLDSYGVSRPTMREAFRLLEADGLIRVGRGARSGAEVCVPTTDVAARHVHLLLSLEQAPYSCIYETLLIVEPPAAHLLAERWTDETLVALGDVLDEEQAAMDSGNHARFTAASALFHTSVVELAGNPLLKVFAQITRRVVVEGDRVAVSTVSEEQRPGVRDRAHEEHSRLLALVRERDADGAAAFWRAHLERRLPRHRSREPIAYY